MISLKSKTNRYCSQKLLLILHASYVSSISITTLKKLLITYEITFTFYLNHFKNIFVKFVKFKHTRFRQSVQLYLFQVQHGDPFVPSMQFNQSNVDMKCRYEKFCPFYIVCPLVSCTIHIHVIQKYFAWTFLNDNTIISSVHLIVTG